MKFNDLVDLILEDAKGMNTYWEDGDKKVTIKEVIEYLDENNVPVKDVSMSKIKPIIINQDYDNKNKGRVNKSNLKYPIIVVKQNGKYKSILDGNHRAYKAINSNDKTIKVREIDLSSSNIPQVYKDLFNYSIEPLEK